jgi:alkylation response protein AidB-like acyl-CoA dehydrogenase
MTTSQATGTDEITEQTVRDLTEQLLADTTGLDEATFHGIQFDRGLSRVDFPKGHGGLEASPKLQKVVDDTLQGAGRRGKWTRNPMGIGMCGPTIVAKGTEEQMARFLRPIFTAEELWCQLFSEPGAGSDVAGLATRAERDGDEWVVNGQKVWTSLAHHADWGLLLARTDPDAPKHRGLTAFIVDMHQPGVEIRPLRQMSGSAGFNEVFFTDARVPDHLRVGEPGEGWRVANATLMNERVSIGGDVIPRGSGPIAGALAAWHDKKDKDPATRDQLAKLWIESEVLRLGNIRSQAVRSKGVPGPEGSVLKLGSALLQQKIASFTVDLLGPAGTLCSGYPTPGSDGGRDEASNDPVLGFLGAQSSTIAGGTSEIMRNILGDRVLGLPREPGIDPNTPWSQIPRS